MSRPRAQSRDAPRTRITAQTQQGVPATLHFTGGNTTLGSQQGVTPAFSLRKRSARSLTRIGRKAAAGEGNTPSCCKKGTKPAPCTEQRPKESATRLRRVSPPEPLSRRFWQRRVRARSLPAPRCHPRPPSPYRQKRPASKEAPPTRSLRTHRAHVTCALIIKCNPDTSSPEGGSGGMSGGKTTNRKQTAANLGTAKKLRPVRDNPKRTLSPAARFLLKARVLSPGGWTMPGQKNSRAFSKKDIAKFRPRCYN